MNQQEKEKLETRWHKCPVCGFTYDTEELASRCKAWCTEHKSCSLEITQYARENRQQGL